MKLLSVIALGLTLIGGAASAASQMKLSVNITVGHNHAHGDNVCTIIHTNVNGALDGKIIYGFHTNGDLYVDDGHRHVFSSRMVKYNGSKITVTHSNGKVFIHQNQRIFKATWYEGGREKFVKAQCK